MVRKRILALLTLLAVLLLCGCDEDEEAPVSAPVSAEEAPSEAYEEETGELWYYTIINGCGSDVTNLRVAFSDEEVWGEDLLSGGSLAMDEDITLETEFTGYPHDYMFNVAGEGVDFRVNDVEVPPDSEVHIVYGQEGIALQVFYGEDRTEYGYYLAEAPQAEGDSIEVLVANTTYEMLEEIYMTPHDNEGWGEKLFPVGVAHEGSWFYTVQGYVPGTPYDIRVVEEGGLEHNMWGVQLTDGCEVHLTLGQGGIAAQVFYPDGSNDYYMADTNDDYTG